MSNFMRSRSICFLLPSVASRASFRGRSNCARSRRDLHEIAAASEVFDVVSQNHFHNLSLDDVQRELAEHAESTALRVQRFLR